MRFINPQYWPWLFLLAAPLVLYLFRRRPSTVRVSTLVFFKTLHKAHQESAWLRLLKRLLSFLLSVLLILLPIGALVRPLVAPAAGDLHTVVILIDRSASMAAVDDDGRTRLDEAVRRVRDRLEALPDAMAVAVIAYDRRGEVLLRSTDRRRIDRVLDSLTVRPVPGDPELALQLAGQLAGLDTPSIIWHATDERREQDDPPAGVSIEHLDVSLDEMTNVGITAFQLRRSPMQRGQFEAYVRLQAAGEKTHQVELEAHLDDKLISLRKLTLDASRSQSLLIPLRGGPAATLRLQLSADGDRLSGDNQVFARVPEVKPVRLIWVTSQPNPFTQLAVTSLTGRGHVQVFLAKPADWPTKRDVDVVLFDHCLPADWPPDVSVILLNPPGPIGPVRTARLRGKGLPVDKLRTAQAGHPILFAVATARISLRQTGVLEAEGALEPLWLGPAGPVLAAGQVRGQRVVAMAFDVGESEMLPLLAAYPMLVGNAVYWSAEPVIRAREGHNLRTGQLIALESPQLTWSRPDKPDEDPQTVQLPGRWAELDRIGLWRTPDGRLGSAALLSARETRPPADVEKTDAGGEGDHGASWTALLRGDLTFLLLWTAFAVLIIESWLFHRHAVY